jgi:hypothetical protein
MQVKIGPIVICVPLELGYTYDWTTPELSSQGYQINADVA